MDPCSQSSRVYFMESIRITCRECQVTLVGSFRPQWTKIKLYLQQNGFYLSRWENSRGSCQNKASHDNLTISVILQILFFFSDCQLF